MNCKLSLLSGIETLQQKLDKKKEATATKIEDEDFDTLDIGAIQNLKEEAVILKFFAHLTKTQNRRAIFACLKYHWQTIL